MTPRREQLSKSLFTSGLPVTDPLALPVAVSETYLLLFGRHNSQLRDEFLGGEIFYSLKEVLEE
jgi:hypothetical protein